MNLPKALPASLIGSVFAATETTLSAVSFIVLSTIRAVFIPLKGLHEKERLPLPLLITVVVQLKENLVLRNCWEMSQKRFLRASLLLL